MGKKNKNQSRISPDNDNIRNSSETSNKSSSPSGKKRKREIQVVVCPSAFPDFTTVGGSTSRRRERERNDNSGNNSKNATPSSTKQPKQEELDIQKTIREIHKFGATGFTGKQAKLHQASEYERLTGRVQKREKIPTKILVGRRKKALKREEKEKMELRESGVVNHGVVGSIGGRGGGSGAGGSSKASSGNKRRKKEVEHGGAGPGVVRGVFGSNKARNTGDRRKMSSRSFGPVPDVGFMSKGMLRVKNPNKR
mmetsp:Transcript_29923/g.59604  ORF Transcript_29923/g.59604 Transcript_29923/m.59604 type:complete len:253 (+) Transcript_29923:132-890(+)